MGFRILESSLDMYHSHQFQNQNLVIHELRRGQQSEICKVSARVAYCMTVVATRRDCDMVDVSLPPVLWATGTLLALLLLYSSQRPWKRVRGGVQQYMRMVLASTGVLLLALSL